MAPKLAVWCAYKYAYTFIAHTYTYRKSTQMSSVLLYDDRAVTP